MSTKRCLWFKNNVPGCLEFTTGSYCTFCAAKKESFRQAKKELRYGDAHRQARERIKPFVEAGKATCARCKKPIVPMPDGRYLWHLDHASDADRRRGIEYLGPSHPYCNMSARDKTSKKKQEEARMKEEAAHWKKHLGATT